MGVHREILRKALATLAAQRPIFHSEADFQHALALRLRSNIAHSTIRLERRPSSIHSRIYIDLWIEVAGQTIATELKYKTRSLEIDIAGEPFRLLDQSAQDIARYDVIKDIIRGESLLRTGEVDSAYAIFVTNDPTYWKPGRRPETVDAEFRLHEGRVLGGNLTWKAHASAGTRRGRDEVLRMRGSYRLKWSEYSNLSCKNGRFRYLMVEATT